MCIHTSTFRGKTVRVVLCTGEIFEDKYLDTKSRYIYFKEHGRILKENITSFGIRQLKPKRN